MPTLLIIVVALSAVVTAAALARSSRIRFPGLFPVLATAVAATGSITAATRLIIAFQAVLDIVPEQKGPFMERQHQLATTELAGALVAIVALAVLHAIAVRRAPRFDARISWAIASVVALACGLAVGWLAWTGATYFDLAYAFMVDPTTAAAGPISTALMTWAGSGIAVLAWAGTWFPVTLIAGLVQRGRQTRAEESRAASAPSAR